MNKWTNGLQTSAAASSNNALDNALNNDLDNALNNSLNYGNLCLFNTCKMYCSWGSGIAGV